MAMGRFGGCQVTAQTRWESPEDLGSLELAAEDRQAFTRELVIVARRWGMRMNERLQAESMSSPRWSALYWLSQAPNGLSQKDLAERVGVEPATLVRTIDGLEQQGLAVRRSCAHDRRVKYVHLTEKANPTVERIRAISDALREDLMDGLEADQIQASLGMLRRLRGNLDRAADGGPPKMRVPAIID
jgi:MarR family transcriptional regulator for hemolysin